MTKHTPEQVKSRVYGDRHQEWIYTPFSQPGEMPRTGQEEHRARAWIVTLNRTCRQAVLQGRKTLG